MQRIWLPRIFYKYLIINNFCLVQLAGLMEFHGTLEMNCIHEWTQQTYGTSNWGGRGEAIVLDMNINKLII